MAACIGIALGDITGISPEVTLKALAELPVGLEDRFLILGNEQALLRENARLGLHLPLIPRQGPQTAGRFLYSDPFGEDLPPDLIPGSPSAARAALAWLKHGAELCLLHELDALVTAPVNKESIIRMGQPFIGQTEFLSELAGTPRTAMMLLGQDGQGHWLRVALATTHVPVRLIADHLETGKIQSVIELTHQACLDLGLAQSRIGVCGLNPHAGEGGALGSEENELIAPAIQAARANGVNVAGPLAADTLFYHAFRGDYDAVVAMYHDQGLVPLKMIGFETGVNWTLGLPFIRTSPDHGTAYNLAGKGLANPSSMRCAIKLAMELVASRKR